MDMKSKVFLEEKGKEKTYQFICDVDSPLGEIHDILCRMKAFIVERVLESQKAEEASKEKTE